jgi:phage-related protein
MPADIKAVKEVGSGTFEIRIWAGDTFRVFFVAKFPEAVYVLHAFQKKTEKTSERDIRIGRERHNEMMNERRKLT